MCTIRTCYKCGAPAGPCNGKHKASIGWGTCDKCKVLKIGKKKRRKKRRKKKRQEEENSYLCRMYPDEEAAEEMSPQPPKDIKDQGLRYKQRPLNP